MFEQGKGQLYTELIMVLKCPVRLLFQVIVHVLKQHCPLMKWFSCQEHVRTPWTTAVVVLPQEKKMGGGGSKWKKRLILCVFIVIAYNKGTTFINQSMLHLLWLKFSKIFSINVYLCQQLCCFCTESMWC